MKAADLLVSWESISLERQLRPGTFMFLNASVQGRKARFLQLAFMESFTIMLLCSEYKSVAI